MTIKLTKNNKLKNIFQYKQMKIRLSISDTIKQTCPEFTAGLVCAQVKNSLYNESLWKEIEEEITQIRQEYPLETINKRETILATRNV